MIQDQAPRLAAIERSTIKLGTFIDLAASSKTRKSGKGRGGYKPLHEEDSKGDGKLKAGGGREKDQTVCSRANCPDQMVQDLPEDAILAERFFTNKVSDLIYNEGARVITDANLWRLQVLQTC